VGHAVDVHFDTDGSASLIVGGSFIEEHLESAGIKRDIDIIVPTNTIESIGDKVKLLVIGCGSIGERHIRNLKTLTDQPILACDSEKERLRFIKEKYLVETYLDVDEALRQQPDAVLICTPPSIHVPLGLRDGRGSLEVGEHHRDHAEGPCFLTGLPF
jgi:threonine dehydrogenase-like Zn-dependent dehydrogenase